MRKPLLKLFGTSVLTVAVISCSSGDGPSISIQPIQDTFEHVSVERSSNMDILWVVDNSGSMESFQEKIRNEFNSFMEHFTSENFNDFQVGVITTGAYLDLNFGKQGENPSAYASWNSEDNGFSTLDRPCTSTVTTNCYNYGNHPDPNLEVDPDERFLMHPVDRRFSSNLGCKNEEGKSVPCNSNHTIEDRNEKFELSKLRSTHCDVCNGVDGEPGVGRDIGILSKSLLEELRLICDDNNLGDEVIANGECTETDDDNNENSITGRKVFLNLFDKIIEDIGISGPGEERAFQSIQATRLNSKNVDFFRDSAHLAIIIVSDEEDSSRPHGFQKFETCTSPNGNCPPNCSGSAENCHLTQFKRNCENNDMIGVFYCNDAYSPLYYRDFLKLLSNDVLGVSVHNMAVNPTDKGYQNDYFDELQGSILYRVFDRAIRDDPGQPGSATDKIVAAINAYKTGVKNSYLDNSVPQSRPYRKTPSGLLYPEWDSTNTQRYNPAIIKECRTTEIPESENRWERFFGRRTTELAESTNGIVASLCAPFSESLKSIAQTITARTTEFFLGNNVPSQETLDKGLIFVSVKNPGESTSIRVNRDTSQKDGWDYNATNNSVVFFGDSVPVSGAEITVLFDRQNF